VYKTGNTIHIHKHRCSTVEKLWFKTHLCLFFLLGSRWQASGWFPLAFSLQAGWALKRAYKAAPQKNQLWPMRSSFCGPILRAPPKPADNRENPQDPQEILQPLATSGGGRHHGTTIDAPPLRSAATAPPNQHQLLRIICFTSLGCKMKPQQKGATIPSTA
jgi:hypothetical protein